MVWASIGRGCASLSALMFAGPYQPGGEQGLRAKTRERLGELGRRGAQPVGTERAEPVEDEQRGRCRGGDPGAGALAPVPPPAGNAAIVAPDHLARLRVL